MTFLRERQSRRSTRNRNGFDPVNYAAVRWIALWFNSQALGGSGDGDLGNALNFWQDAGDTIPNLAISTTSDDLTTQDAPLTGTCGALTLTDTGNGAHPMTGGTINLPSGAIVTNVDLAGGTFAVSSFGSLNLVGGTFDSGTMGGAIIFNSSASYVWNSVPAGQTINDNGTATWGATVVNGPVNATGSGIAVSTTTTFSGSVTSTTITGAGAGTFSGTVTCAGAISGGSSFSGTGNTAASFSATMSGGTLTTNSFTGVHSLGGVTLTGASATYTPSARTVAGTSMTTDGSPKSIVINDQNGISFTITAPAVPNPNDVLNTATPAGNWQRPNNETSDAAAAQWIKSGKAFGVSGASTGTLPSGGGGSPLIGNPLVN